MSGQVDEVVEALRSAVRSLRAAERVLLNVNQTEQPEVVQVTAPISSPEIDKNESALLSFILDSAKTVKAYEEEDPQSFLSRYLPMVDNLVEAVLKGEMYQSCQGGTGFVPLDNVGATTLFEKTLRGMRGNNLQAKDFIEKYVGNPSVKTWGDVDTNEDLVIFRFETDGPVEASMFLDNLAPLLERAKDVPGAVDRCRSAAMDSGVEAPLYDSTTGQVDPSLVVSGVTARWVASVPVSALIRDVVDVLSVIEVDDTSPSVGWWDAARASREIPDLMLPIVRGKDKSAVIRRADVADVESWAASLPDWYGELSNPIIFRNAMSNDILGT